MIYWLTKAAESGLLDAQRDLGYRLAIYWYKKAALAGDKKAQYNLGLSYFDGDGVKPSKRWSRFWLEKAAQQKHSKAKAVLERLFDK